MRFGGVLRSVGFTLLKEKVRWCETSCMQFGDQIFDPVEKKSYVVMAKRVSTVTDLGLFSEVP